MKRFLDRMINAERTVLVHLSDRMQIQNPHSSMDLQVGQEYVFTSLRVQASTLPNADTLTSIQPELCHLLVVSS